MQFQYYYDAFQNVHGKLYTNDLRQECNIHKLHESIKEFIASLLCPPPHEKSFYSNACIIRQCDRC